jgi:hypothetical protein
LAIKIAAMEPTRSCGLPKRGALDLAVDREVGESFDEESAQDQRRLAPAAHGFWRTSASPRGNRGAQAFRRIRTARDPITDCSKEATSMATSTRRLWRVWATIVALAPLLAPPPQAGAGETPKLIVVLVFDQLRADYLTRWGRLFEEGGFRRLCDEGVWLQNCRYPYAITVTAAGHASIATGASPRTHGVVGNDWFDRAEGRTVSSVEGTRWKLRLWTDDPALAAADRAAGSPEKLLAPAFGDVVKEKYGDGSRVISLSVKDRSAIFLGGRKADACYWTDSKTGLTATSSYYGDRIHAWVRKFNNARPADRWIGGRWERLRADVDYDREAGPDDAPGEGEGVLQGRTFPHPFPQSAGPQYYEALAVSPFASDLLTELAILAIREEKLGRRDAPDVLCVSYSSNDLIGHVWGPDSHEVLDATLRSDRNLRDLLDELDRSVGAGRYLVAVTSDHGVCPLPDQLRARGIDAGELRAPNLVQRAEAFLRERRGSPEDARWIAGAANSWVAVDRKLAAERGADPDEVAADLAAWLAQQSGVARAVVRRRIEQSESDEDDEVLRMLRLSYHPDRCGDVAVVPKPHYFFAFAPTGTSHGTPYDYDVHVPLLFYGARVKPGARSELVAPQAVAAVSLEALGIDRPPTVEFAAPDGVIE